MPNSSGNTRFKHLPIIFDLCRFKICPKMFARIFRSWKNYFQSFLSMLKKLLNTFDLGKFNCPTFSVGKLKHLRKVFFVWFFRNSNNYPEHFLWIKQFPIGSGLGSSKNCPTVLVLENSNNCPTFLILGRSNNCPTVWVLGSQTIGWYVLIWVLESQAINRHF